MLHEINVSSKLLQTISLDISETIYQLNKTKKNVQEDRTDENFEKIPKKARELANELDVEDSFPLEQVRARRKNKHFGYESRDDLVVDPQHNFKINFYYQILDLAIQSLNDRFVQLEGHGQLF